MRLAIVCLFVLTGCAGRVRPESLWEKDGASVKETRAAYKACQQDAGVPSPVVNIFGTLEGTPYLQECMTGRGFEKK